MKIDKDRLWIAPLAGAVVWGALSGASFNFYRQPLMWLVLPITILAVILFAAVYRRAPMAFRMIARGQPGATVVLHSTAGDMAFAMLCLFAVAVAAGAALRLIVAALVWIGT